MKKNKKNKQTPKVVLLLKLDLQMVPKSSQNGNIIAEIRDTFVYCFVSNPDTRLCITV